MSTDRDHTPYLDNDYKVEESLEKQLDDIEAFDIELYGCWLCALEKGLIVPRDHGQLIIKAALVEGKDSPHRPANAWLKYQGIKQASVGVSEDNAQKPSLNAKSPSLTKCSCSNVSKSGCLT